MSARKRAASRADRRRKARSRPTPKWLNKTPNLDEIARARCLMILRVLSGEQPVTEAISAAKISRGTYYQLETRALNAMLTALNPMAAPDGAPDLSGPSKRIADLETKVKRLEQEKRRSERLLLLTRKVIRPVPITTGRGPKGPRSTRNGKRPSPDSREKATKSNPSIRTPDGEAAPSSGIGS